MSLFTYPWAPERLKGNLLYLRNSQTGQSRTQVISQDRISSLKKEIERFNALKQGLPYPWQPVKLEGNYLYYRSVNSGLITKVHIPESMLSAMTEEFRKGNLSKRGKAVIINDLTGRREQIDRGDFKMLREMMTAREKALSPFASHPFTKRVGIVDRVINGNTIVVDGVVVRIRYTETPSFKADKEGYLAAKQATEVMALGKQATLTINLDNPTDSEGNTLADIELEGKLNLSEALMAKGIAPISTVEDPTSGRMGYLDWFEWGLLDKISTPYYAWTAFVRNVAVWRSIGQLGSAGIMDKFSLSDTFTFTRLAKQYRGDPVRYLGEKEKGTAEGSFYEKMLIDIVGDPTAFMPYGKIGRATGLARGFGKVSSRITSLLNLVDLPVQMGRESTGARINRAFRQFSTLPNPAYHAINWMGDTWNALLGGMRNPIRIIQADRTVKLPKSLSLDSKVLITSTTGKKYTVAEIRALGESNKYPLLHSRYWFGDTASKFREDRLDKLFAPMQKAANYESVRMRRAVFIDRLAKGDLPDQAYQHALKFQINYDPRSLTNFEQRFISPVIPFYMWIRQNTLLQASQMIEQPYMYTSLAKIVQKGAPIEEERAKLRDYQKNFILVRNPTSPDKFFRVPLPVEDVATLYQKLSSPELALLMLYPYYSAIPELITDKNFLDNTRPSKDMITYAEKKFSAGWYYRNKAWQTTPDFKERVLYAGVGLRTVEPTAEVMNLGDALVDARLLKGYDQLQAERLIDKQQQIVKRLNTTQKFMANQTALTPEQRDRPERWGVLDYVLAPFNFLAWNVGAVMRNNAIKQRTGKWGSYSWKDRLYVSDTNTLIRATKIFLKQPATAKRFEEKGSKYVWREYVGDKAPKDQWEGGFWDKLSTDISTDPLIWASWVETAFLSTPIKMSSGRMAKLTPYGKELYTQLIQKFGQYEARHQFSYLIRTEKAIRSSALWKEGIRFPGINYDIIPAKYSTELVGRLTMPIAQAMGATAVKLFSHINTILRPAAKTPIEYREYSTLIQYLETSIKQQTQVLNAEIYDFQLQANKLLGRGSGRVITEMFDDPTKRSQYPYLKPLIEKIQAHTKNIENAEKARELLETARTNYLYRELTPEAKVAYSAGNLKTPKEMAERILQERSVIGDPIFGGELNPYNRQRMYEMTVAQMNDWSMKNNGFALFTDDAFKVLKSRNKLHVTSVQVHDFLANIKTQFGKPPDEKVKGYKISRIEQLQDVQLPEGLVNQLEKDPLIRSYAKELEKPAWAVRGGNKLIGAYDWGLGMWKFGATALRPAWYFQNLGSSIGYNTAFLRLNPYWYYKSVKIRWNLAKGLYAPDDVVFVSDFGKKYTAADLQELMAEKDTKNIVFGQVGQVEEWAPKAGFFQTFRRMTSYIGNQVERFVRAPAWFDRLQKGDTPEHATQMVKNIHFDYSREAMTPFERNVLHRTMGFYVWYSRNPILITQQLITNPLPFVALPKIMNAWNEEQGKVERNYLSDNLLAKLIFRVPNTQGAWIEPAFISGINSAFTLAQVFSKTQFNFFWDEAKKDPTIIEKFAKHQLLDVDWLQRGGGIATVQGNDIVIEYKETGETITASLGTDKLVFTDDQTGIVLGQFPTSNIGNKTAINTDNRPLEKLAARWLSPFIQLGIEWYIGRDLAFGAPTEEGLSFAKDTLLGIQTQQYKEMNDPTMETWEKTQELVFGNIVYWVANYFTAPMPENLVKEAVDIQIIKLNGDFSGCGWD